MKFQLAIKFWADYSPLFNMACWQRGTKRRVMRRVAVTVLVGWFTVSR